MNIESQLVALMWGVKHMEETICGCDHFLDIKDKTELLRHSLISGIIASYTRSFVEGQGLSSIRAKFSKFENPNMKHEHERICDARRVIYGHRDTINETSIFEHTPPSEEINKVIVTLDAEGKGTFEIRRSSLPDDYVEQIKELAQFQRTRMIDARNAKLEHYLRMHDSQPGQYFLNYGKTDGGEPNRAGNG